MYKVEDTPEDSVVPVYEVPLSEEDLLERELWLEEKAEIIAIEEAKVANKETALAKLEKLGITQEELSALLGS